jgi:hypothetical protein
MIVDQNRRTDVKVIELSDLPWKKVVRGEAKIRDQLQICKEGEASKAIALILSQDLALVIPKVLVSIPKANLETLSPEEAKIEKIKEMFYDEVKTIGVHDK